MSIVNAIPQVWAANILRALNTLLVYGNPAIINTDYDGDIAAQGDTVKITTLGDVTVKDYSRDADIEAPEALTDAQLTLTIDQQKYFNFAVDDIDKRQAIPGLMDEASRRAAYGLRKSTDSFIASHFTDIAAGNFSGSDASPEKVKTAGVESAYNSIIDLGVLLDATDTPEDSRFVVVPPWMVGYLEKDLRFIGYGTAPNRKMLEEGLAPTTNGLVGRAGGFDVYQSNQVPNTEGKKYKIIAGHKMAWSFADQLVETVAFRPERRFADALKGLHVYGAKVVRPSNLACLVANNE